MHQTTWLQQEGRLQGPDYALNYNLPRVLDFVLWVLGFGFWVLCFGFCVLGFGFCVLGFGCWEAPL